MSKVASLPKTLPTKDLPFECKITGSATGRKYSGSFVVQVPGTRQLIAIGVETAKLSGGVPPDLLDANTYTLNRSIALLSACLVEAPEWFTNGPDDQKPGMSYGLDTFDLNVPIEVSKAADALIDKWHEELKGTGDGK